MDQDGVTDVPVSELSVRPNDDDAIAPNTAITLELRGAPGVRFNTSTSDPGADYTVRPKNVTYDVGATPPTASEPITFGNLRVDVDPDAANASLEVTTNTGDAVVDSNAPNQLRVTAAAPEDIEGDVTDDGSFGTDPGNTTTALTAGATRTSEVLVTSKGDPFGGAIVNLSVVSSPRGVDDATLLNESRLTTSRDGTAAFSFRGETAGTYVVEAAVNGSTVRFTYEVQPAAPTQATVTEVKGAVADGRSADTGLAVYEVRLADAYGNPVTDARFDAKLTADRDTSAIDAYYDYDRTTGTFGPALDAVPDNIDRDVTYVAADDPVDPGVFYLAANATAAGDLAVTIESNTFVASGTASVVAVEGTSLTIDDTTVVVGERMAVTVAGTTATGDRVRVPRLGVTFGNESAGVVSRPAATTVNDSGVASTTVDALAAGREELVASVAGRSQDGQSVTVETVAEAASSSRIAATPTTTGREAVHTVRLTVGTNAGGEPLERLGVDYAVGVSPADAGNVGRADVFRVTVDGTDVTDDVTAVTPAVGGEELVVGFDGTTRLPEDGTLVVQYRDVVNPISAGRNRVDVTLNGGRSPVDESTANLSATPGGTVSVSGVPTATERRFGEELNLTVDVTNAGGSSTGVDVELRVDRDHDGDLEGDETVATTRVDSLAADETRSVLVDRPTSRVGVPNENGSYVYGVVAGGATAVGVLDLSANDASFPSGVPGIASSGPPGDPDGDGYHEDVDGDGTFEFLDVVDLLFADWDRINRNPSGRTDLNFDGSGDGRVAFLDVVNLLFEL